MRIATGFVAGENAAAVLAGALQRDAGEAAGNYAITQGSLVAADGNYAIAYTPGTLAIAAAPPPPAPTPPSPAPSPPPAPAPAPAPPLVQGEVTRPPYPQPEVPRAPACASARSEKEGASCVRPLPLRVVGDGVRLPALR